MQVTIYEGETYHLHWDLTIILETGQQATWWLDTGLLSTSFTWARFDVAPDVPDASVQIVEQWAESLPSGRVRRRITFRNRGSKPVSFQPKTLVTPTP